LRHQDAIEGVTVIKRQFENFRRMLGRHWQRLKPTGFKRPSMAMGSASRQPNAALIAISQIEAALTKTIFPESEKYERETRCLKFGVSLLALLVQR
jgi:hypothetical protein